jgi:hypothetical protein
MTSTWGIAVGEGDGQGVAVGDGGRWRSECGAGLRGNRWRWRLQRGHWGRRWSVCGCWSRRWSVSGCWSRGWGVSGRCRVALGGGWKWRDQGQGEQYRTCQAHDYRTPAGLQPDERPAGHHPGSFPVHRLTPPLALFKLSSSACACLLPGLMVSTRMRQRRLSVKLRVVCALPSQARSLSGAASTARL